MEEKISVLSKFYNEKGKLLEVMQGEEMALQHFCRQLLLCFGFTMTKMNTNDQDHQNHDSYRIYKKWRVAYTAMIYFRRFYMTHCLIEYDPRLIM